MTISSATSKAGPYNGNGSTTAFAFAFKVFSSADLKVVLTDASGIDTTQTLTTHYTVTLNGDQDVSPGGTVTMLTAPATGYKLTILRNVVLTQGTDLPNQGAWYPSVVENALDKLTMITQQLDEKVGRSIQVGVSETDPNALVDAINTAATNASNSASAASASASAAAASAASIPNIPATANSWTADQTYGDYKITQAKLQDQSYSYYDSSTTNALNYTNGLHQRWAPNTGAQTLSITNWPPSGALGELLIEGVNLGAATITWPTINWIKSDGTTTTTFASNGVTLQASGTDWVMLWTRDAGTTIYGKIVR